ncbi:phospholipid carrier-dependent glycosyltransferase, partial [bacterium]|nr:phospholipid carrier-dependent glycosyltransferase [bacterium]
MVERLPAWTRHETLALLAIVTAFVALAAQYARVTPPFEAADEGAHFLYVHHLLTDRELPVIVDRATLQQQTDPARFWAIEAHQPPLYYALGALLIAGTDRSDLPAYLRSNDLIFIRGTTAANPNQWLHAPERATAQTGLAIAVLRGYSIALGALTLIFVFLAAREAFPGTPVPPLAALLVALIPTFLSINASINNDNLVTTLYSAGLWLTLRLLRREHIPTSEAVALGLVLAAIALTKVNGLSLFGVVGAALIYRLWRGDLPLREVLRFGVVAGGMVALLAGWWYARNLSLYGDPLALAATQSLWGRAFEIAPTSGDPLAELWRVYRSFWMMTGYLAPA